MWLASALVALITAVAAERIVARLQHAGSFVARFVVVGGGVGVVLSGYLTGSYGLNVEFWAGLLLYGFACELYVFLVTLVGSSISVSLLLFLRCGTLSRVEVDRVYSGRVMVAGRVESLCANGLLSRVAGGYALTPRARALLTAFRVLRRFFHRRSHPAIETQ